MLPTTTTTTTNTSTLTSSMTTKTLSCGSCHLQFSAPEAFRAHAKSSEQSVASPLTSLDLANLNNSIEKIRSRAVDAGTYTRYRSSSPDDSLDNSRSESRTSTRSADDEVDSSDERPDFVPEECIFCGEDQETFDDNLIHMASTHSFIIPFQNALTVDLETIVWYFHLVINSYHECILCGRGRSNVEAVRQHMTGAGHCRFNVEGEITEFYDLDEIESRNVDAETSTMALSSGKVVKQRETGPTAKTHRQQRRALIRASSTTERPEIGDEAVEDDTGKALTKSERKIRAFSNHLSQLRAGDQAAIAHLTSGQQHTLLNRTKRAANEGQRDETLAKTKIERKSNKTLQGHFRLDGVGRRLG